MTAALLSIGDELLRGEIVNTNAQWLGDELSSLGCNVAAAETVGDDVERIVRALKRLKREHDLVVVTGGLGPTSDDVTAEAVAAAYDLSLVRFEDAYASIERRLQERGREMRPGHEKQAMLPEGAQMLPNAVGSAPGFVLGRTPDEDEGEGAAGDEPLVFVLPGVPREMKAMFDRHIRPTLADASSHDHYDAYLHTFGVGESWIAEQLNGFAGEHPDVVVGFRAADGLVAIRVSGRSDAGEGDARMRVEAAVATIRDKLGNAVFGEGDQTMPMLAGKGCRTRGWRLAVAESCTGGLIAQQLTSEPASDFFVGGAVTYANHAKSKLLGVSEDTLRGHGAVSAEVAAEMAEGARRAFECDVAISVTGIAGPTGATNTKPVGLVHWAVASPDGTICEHRVFAGDRNQVQSQAATAALDLLRRTLSAPRPSRPARMSRPAQ